MSNTTITDIVVLGCGAISLIAFATLVLAPALSSYQRPMHRVGAALLSLYVLAAFVGVGVLVGALIIFEWPRLF